MLDENDVTKAVSNHIKSQGYVILQECTTNDRGVDIIAKHPSGSGNLSIEAKGARSSKPGSPRYGQDYRKAEVFDRVAKGIYTVIAMYANRKDGDQVGLACPETAWFLEYLQPTKPVLDSLGITVYIVRPSLAVYTL
jgi:hypothetical protein